MRVALLEMDEASRAVHSRLIALRSAPVPLPIPPEPSETTADRAGAAGFGSRAGGQPRSAGAASRPTGARQRGPGAADEGAAARAARQSQSDDDRHRHRARRAGVPVEAGAAPVPVLPPENSEPTVVNEPTATRSRIPTLPRVETRAPGAPYTLPANPLSELGADDVDRSSSARCSRPTPTRGPASPTRRRRPTPAGGPARRDTQLRGPGGFAAMLPPALQGRALRVAPYAAGRGRRHRHRVRMRGKPPAPPAVVAVAPAARARGPRPRAGDPAAGGEDRGARPDGDPAARRSRRRRRASPRARNAPARAARGPRNGAGAARKAGRRPKARPRSRRPEKAAAAEKPAGAGEGRCGREAGRRRRRPRRPRSRRRRRRRWRPRSRPRREGRAGREAGGAAEARGGREAGGAAEGRGGRKAGARRETRAAGRRAGGRVRRAGRVHGPRRHRAEGREGDLGRQVIGAARSTPRASPAVPPGSRSIASAGRSVTLDVNAQAGERRPAFTNGCAARAARWSSARRRRARRSPSIASPPGTAPKDVDVQRYEKVPVKVTLKGHQPWNKSDLPQGIRDEARRPARPAQVNALATADWALGNGRVLAVFGPVLILTGIAGFLIPPRFALMSGAPAYNVFHIVFGMIGTALVVGEERDRRRRVQPRLRHRRRLPGGRGRGGLVSRRGSSATSPPITSSTS